MTKPMTSLPFRQYACFLGLVLLSLSFFGCKKPPEVEIETVQLRTLIATVSESGEVQPNVEVPIAPDVSGEVTALYVREGQFVQQGELLFEIRPDNLRAAYQQAQAALSSAKADYENAGAVVKQREVALTQDSINFTRNRQLFRDSIIAESEFDNFRMQYQIAKQNLSASQQSQKASFFRIQSAEASSRQSYDQLTRTRVYASMAGTITRLQVELGQRVVGTGMMTGTEAVKIADLSHMHVKVLINENDIVRLRVGDSATVEVDAFADKVLKGKVQEIAYSAEMAQIGTTDQVTNYEVKVAIDPESYRNDVQLMRGLAAHQSPLRPGMSALVKIFTDKIEGVPALPIRAVTIDRELKESGNVSQEVVFLYDAATQKVVKTKVLTGISDEEYIQIKEGLQAGATFVVGPYGLVQRDLKDETEVQLKGASEEAK